MGQPFITVIIPMRNEELFIGPCLESILSGDYPAESMEILVLDGESSDRSRSIVDEIASRDHRVKLLENPGRIQAKALNIGIQMAKGEIIARMDAHAIYAPDYLKWCAQLLAESGASAVGGRQTAKGEGLTGRAMASAMSSAFGAGDAAYRLAKERTWTDTVFLGAWRKEVINKAGGFNENLAVNEDYELNWRLRRNGGKILLAPELQSTYFVRSSLGRMIRQYFRYGMFKARMLGLHPESLRWRQLAAPALALTLALSAIILPLSKPAGLLIPAIYIAGVLSASVIASVRTGPALFPLLAIIFPAMHLSWGCGFWAGILKFGVPRLTPSIIMRSFAGGTRRA